MYEMLNFSESFDRKVRELLATNFKINKGGKLEPSNPMGTIKSPWIFVNYDARRKYCSHWNQIFCGKFDVIPTFCRFNCWKTVVYPENVMDTFLVYKILRQLDLPSKVGMDLRDYTYAGWGAYIYGDSLSQGRYYWETVRGAMPDNIEVILKRGCTEMERKIPSYKWDDMTAEDIAREERLNDLFDFSEEHFFQSAWQKADIKERWIKRAIQIKDPTAKAAAMTYGSDGAWERLVVKSVQYQKKSPHIDYQNLKLKLSKKNEAENG